MPKQPNNLKKEEILNKILNILKIDEVHNYFSLKEVDNNFEIQKLILDLEEDIKSAFCCSKWTCFKKQTKRRWLSFIKNISKDLKIKIVNSKKSVKNEEGNFISETIYIFLR